MKRILLSIAMLAVTVTMMAQANVYFKGYFRRIAAENL